MKLDSIKIQNFRSYKDEVQINIDNLTTFIGKNDIGKSTILEALDIFFNEKSGVVQLDKEDLNKIAQAENDYEITISCEFSQLPSKINIDSINETTFEHEYLLNKNEKLEIVKKYTIGQTVKQPKIYINALHPTNENCKDLLLRTKKDYQKIINDNNIQCEDKRVNALMRKEIWKHYGDLQLKEVLVETTKEDAKNIWEKISIYLPKYFLFQADRKNTDTDSEIQDPLKNAVVQILQQDDIRIKLEEIQKYVLENLENISKSTLEKIKEMDESLASSLTPIIPLSSDLNWKDVFKKVSISSDNNIPINKRGSGVKRLILFNFFRAEAERQFTNTSSSSIIYAIEEPETSQHADYQKTIIDALEKLSLLDNYQIILTTHSSKIVKCLDLKCLRLIQKDNLGNNSVKENIQGVLPYPSLNEINYIAFKDINEEYHNELYGYIQEKKWLSDLQTEVKSNNNVLSYIKLDNNGNQLPESDIILCEYIRHQIHHPENKKNIRFTTQELEKSIIIMQDFVKKKGITQ